MLKKRKTPPPNDKQLCVRLQREARGRPPPGEVRTFQNFSGEFLAIFVSPLHNTSILPTIRFQNKPRNKPYLLLRPAFTNGYWTYHRSSTLREEAKVAYLVLHRGVVLGVVVCFCVCSPTSVLFSTATLRGLVAGRRRFQYLFRPFRGKSPQSLSDVSFESVDARGKGRGW